MQLNKHLTRTIQFVGSNRFESVWQQPSTLFLSLFLFHNTLHSAKNLIDIRELRMFQGKPQMLSRSIKLLRANSTAGKLNKTIRIRNEMETK